MSSPESPPLDRLSRLIRGLVILQAAGAEDVVAEHDELFVYGAKPASVNEHARSALEAAGFEYDDDRLAWVKGL